MSTKSSIIQLAQAVIETESKAVAEMKDRIDSAFERACRLMLNTSGRVVVVGMGKSGHIGSKIAATFASTGTPSFFVHPGEASHGDLGMITEEDVILALSNSGETHEVLTLLPVIKRRGIPLLAMTGNPNSQLAINATVHINVQVTREACPLGLAPTSSTTAVLAMGDALAVALLDERGFTADDFALSHPGGTLGRRLLLHIDDIMHSNQLLPKVLTTNLISEALMEMTSKCLGMTTVVNTNGTLAGIFTDGDLRRAIENRIDLHATPVSEVMTANCQTIQVGTLAATALKTMQDKKINALVVTENNFPVGALNMHDLLKSGVV